MLMRCERWVAITLSLGDDDVYLIYPARCLPLGRRSLVVVDTRDTCTLTCPRFMNVLDGLKDVTGR